MSAYLFPSWRMKTVVLIGLFLVGLSGILFGWWIWHGRKTTVQTTSPTDQAATAIFAGGCFWCVESDFEKREGVIDVVSGYSGGEGEEPTYKTYAKLGHREVVEVTYDPEVVSFGELTSWLLTHSDPTDDAGSFADRGVEYTSAIYVQNDEEREGAVAAIEAVAAKRVFEKPIVIPILSREVFWPAEEYHQDYAHKNPIRYKAYRAASGRDAFLKRMWVE